MKAPAGRILVIDDEEGVRDMLRFALGGRGYEVAAAASGEEGLRLAEAAPFDAVICDIKMPGIDGESTLKIFKRRWPRTEVIMATGYATMTSAVQCIEAGACQYLAKPFDIEEMCALLSTAVKMSRSPRKNG